MNPSSPAMLSVSVPMEIPSPERIEAILREECARVARERLVWVSAKEAARYCATSLREFYRMKKNHGLPTSEVGGCIAYHVADLDRLKLLHMMTKGSPAENAAWPSIQARNEILRTQPMAAAA